MKRAGLAVLLVAAACGDGVQANSGLDALMQVTDAQFFRGTLPSAAGGPQVGAMRTLGQQLRVGQTQRSLSGSVDATAVAIALQLDGDLGYWVKPVGGADPVLTDQLGFDALLSFSRFVTPGDHDVQASATDADGHWGAMSPLRFTFVDLDAPPKDELVVSLSWDVDADLDLHVVQPDGLELWSRKASAYEAPVVGPVDQAAADAAGTLDFDSNSQCHIDGRRLENVLYGAGAPSGHYLVRVDTFSLCGQPAARWVVKVTYLGQTVASADGIALPASTRFPHERGAGALVAEFDVP